MTTVEVRRWRCDCSVGYATLIARVEVTVGTVFRCRGCDTVWIVTASGLEKVA